MLNFIELDKPVLKFEGFDLALECEKAFVKPGFERALNEKRISLNCAFEGVFFPGLEEKEGISLLFDKLLFKSLKKLVFDDMHVELAIYGETVEFLSCEANSRDAKLRAFGYLTESGDFDITAKIFFSPAIVKGFPEEVRMMLTEESFGWLSYFLHINSGEGESSLSLSSDRFNINFERLEVR